MIGKILHRKLNIEQQETLLKYGGELRCSWRVESSCSNSDIRHVTLATNLVIIHGWENDYDYKWNKIFRSYDLDATTSDCNT